MANTDLGGLEISVIVQSEQLTQGLQKAQNQISNFQTKANKSFSGLSAGAVAAGNTISNIITKVASMLTSNLDYATKRLDTLNRFPIALQNLGIAADESSAAIQQLSEYTLGLPTTLNDAAEKVQYFTSATENVWQSIKIFEALNDAIVSGAQNTEVQSTALYQWSQAIVRGSFDMETEFNALVVANAKAVNEISEQLLGLDSNFNDLWEAIKDGRIAMSDIVNTMVDLDENGSGALESWSKRARNSVAGIDVAITRLKTNIGKAMAVVGEEIGWKNIYTFVNNVGDAIYKAGQYVAAFVRILKEAFAWVSALFGGKGSTSEIVTETGDASENVGGIASGAADAADNLGSAAKNAKKLNQQLASFDEMNVLREQADSSGGSGSSGGGGGGLNGLNFDWDNSSLFNVSDKVGEIADKIKAKLQEAFGDVDFEPLKRSFENLYNAIKKFGSGAGKILKDFLKNYLVPMAKWTITDALPHFLDSTADALNRINWDKIADAFNELWDALVPFSQTIGEGLLWFYDNVLIPLGLWGVNDVVPAFLHALSGAIQLVTAAIQEAAPFVDFLWQNFLWPIAQWTGGVIVTVLNGVGDALSWIAQNEAAIRVVELALAAFAAYEIVKHATTAINTFMDAFTIASQGIPAAQTVVETGGGAFASLGANIGSATSAMGGLSGVMTGIGEAIFSPATIAVLGLVAAYEALRVIQEYDTLLTMEAKVADELFTTAQEKATEATGWYNDAIERQKDLKDELRDATNEVTSAELNLLKQQETTAKSLDSATAVASKYGLTVDEAKAYVKTLDIASGNLTDKDRELAKAIAELENNQNRETEAVGRLTDAKQVVTNKTEESTNQAWKEIMALKEQQIQAQLSEGKYEDVSQSLQNLADSSGEFQLANGDMVKFTKEDMKSMAEFIGDQLASIDENNGKAWKSVWDKANRSTDELKRLAREDYLVGTEEAGANFQKGIAQGIFDNQWRVIDAARQSAEGAIAAFNKAQKSQSPSKVMKKSGGFFSQGVALGILGGVPEVERAAEKLANMAVDTFDDYGAGFGDAHIDLSKKVSGMLDVEAEQTPVHVVVNVGEDKLIDKIINGANDLAFMQNRSVLNV